MILTFCFVAPTSFAACRSTSDAECDPACGASEYCCLGSCRALGSVCGPDAPDASDGDGDGDGAVSQDSAVVDAAPVDPCAPRNGVVTSSACRDAVTMVACLSTVAGNTFDCSAFGAVCVEQQQQSSDGPMTKSACAPAGSTLCDPLHNRPPRSAAERSSGYVTRRSCRLRARTSRRVSFLRTFERGQSLTTARCN